MFLCFHNKITNLLKFISLALTQFLVLVLYLQIRSKFWVDKNKVELQILPTLLGKFIIILPWKVASVRLRSPLLVHDILPAVFVTSNLREDEGTLEPRVQRTRHVVVDPLFSGRLVEPGRPGVDRTINHD
jgi:hypothetical protein